MNDGKTAEIYRPSMLTAYPVALEHSKKPGRYTARREEEWKPESFADQDR
jgi:hypothetical protein